tara:strand:- start:127 stop:231 length:105 start_codon:yes stop_codon:yes gene_type:complete
MAKRKTKKPTKISSTTRKSNPQRDTRLKAKKNVK